MGMYENVHKCLKMGWNVQNIQKYEEMYNFVRKCTEWENAQKCLKMYGKVWNCMKKYENLQNIMEIFRNVQTCSKIETTTSKEIKLNTSGKHWGVADLRVNYMFSIFQLDILALRRDLEAAVGYIITVMFWVLSETFSGEEPRYSGNSAMFSLIFFLNLQLFGYNMINFTIVGYPLLTFQVSKYIKFLYLDILIVIFKKPPTQYCWTHSDGFKSSSSS